MAGLSSEHKVRGGSALSLALGRAGGVEESIPGLGKSSPSDSAASTLTASHQQLSEGPSGTEWPSPAVSPLAAALACRQPGSSSAPASPVAPPARLPHSAATAPQAAAAAAQREHRRRLPFLACFGAAGGTRVLGEEGSARLQPAVSASEVGIRPCFYWLESPGISEEDRLFAEANARWLKSDCQDDAVVIEHFGGLPHQTFAGVFDGHGPYGRSAAKFASTRLPQLLAAKAGGAGSERRRLRALRQAFLDVNAAMCDMAQAGFDASLSGTTACCVLLVGRKVLVASTGDSRCVVARCCPGGGLEVVPLTWDAKPSLPEEQKRIAMAGGVVKQLLDERGQRVGAYRVFSRGDDVLPGLAMSRSLGDLYAHEVGVSPEPVLNTYTLGERDLFLILATDGLWDIMANEEAADFVQRYKAQRDLHISCAEALTLEAQERWKALHDEAFVDDISCVILHTAGLPPAEREASVPRPLARAASCNDEANELYMQWRLEKERNPSNHKPKQYFKHLYGGEGEGSGSSGAGSRNGSGVNQAAVEAATEAAAAAGAVPGAAAQQQQPAGGRASTPPPPPASPVRLDGPQYPYHLSSSAGGSSSSPLDRSAAQLSSLCSPAAESALGLGRGSGLRMHDEALSSPSPISSYGDLASEELSESSLRRGSAFAGAAAWADAAALARRSSTGPQPIPASRKDSLEPAEGTSQFVPLEVLLRPVRKAYPSTSNMQQAVPYSYSYRSDGLVLAAADTPRSTDSAALERKVRGGMSRSLSYQSSSQAYLGGGGGGLVSHPSLPKQPSNASLGGITSCRTSGDFRSSPAGEGPLSAPLSPPQSPVVVPLGGGYTRVQVAGSRVVHSLAPLHGFASMQHGGPPGAALSADLVARGSHLSRRATDAAGLAEAMTAIQEAEGRAAPSSCAAAAAAAAAGAAGSDPRGGSPAQH
ncbi:hypothetical protein ABPG75_007326 [Micractinium tetrahymenae]